ncbi:MAG: hypothetical protein EZS28_006185 [Streblomastix strix]|uniref:Uncharacterized protein n=1 Tax=Streblomastix strix TaxID=222440 RepID=A0A5J4WTQ7_9EUKA|nr:MAG: hypothetical protein EZS28_006185 [Streblomastix strix]
MQTVTFEQFVCVLCGDSRVIPEVERAVQSGIKKRYKILRLPEVLQDFTQFGTAESEKLKSMLEKKEQIPRSLLASAFATKIIEEKAFGILQKLQGDGDRLSELAGQAGLTLESIKDKKGDKKGIKSKKDEVVKQEKMKTVSTKGKGGKEITIQQGILDSDIIEQQYTTDPDDSPDFPNYPEQFLIISQFPEDLGLLICLQRELCKIGRRINALVNIRAVPLVPYSFIEQYALSSSAKLFPILPQIQVLDQVTHSKDAKSGKNKQIQSASSDKKGQKSVQSKKGDKEEVIEEEMNNSTQLMLTQQSQGLLQQKAIDIKSIGYGALDELMRIPEQLCLFDQVTLTRAQLIDGPSSVLKDVFLLEVLSGQPFIPSLHVVALEDRDKLKSNEQQQQLLQMQQSDTKQGLISVQNQVVSSLDTKGGNQQTSDKVGKQSNQQQSNQQQQQSSSSKEGQQSNISQLTGLPLNDALSVLSNIAPHMKAHIKDREIDKQQSVSQVDQLKQCFEGSTQKELMCYPPPSIYHSSIPNEQPFSTLNPNFPSDSSQNSFSYTSISSNVTIAGSSEIMKQRKFFQPSLPIPHHNILNPPSLLYVPKDGVTLLREIHLGLAQKAHRITLYKIWVLHIPKTIMNRYIPYELYISSNYNWVRLPYNDSRVVQRVDTYLNQQQKKIKKDKEEVERKEKEAYLQREKESQEQEAIKQAQDDKKKGIKKQDKQIVEPKSAKIKDKQQSPGKKGNKNDPHSQLDQSKGIGKHSSNDQQRLKRESEQNNEMDEMKNEQSFDDNKDDEQEQEYEQELNDQFEDNVNVSEESKLDGRFALDMRRYKRTIDKLILVTGIEIIEKHYKNQHSSSSSSSSSLSSSPSSTTSSSTINSLSSISNIQSEKRKQAVIPIIPKAPALGYKHWFNIKEDNIQYLQELEEKKEKDKIKQKLFEEKQKEWETIQQQQQEKERIEKEKQLEKDKEEQLKKDKQQEKDKDKLKDKDKQQDKQQEKDKDKLKDKDKQQDKQQEKDDNKNSKC